MVSPALNLPYKMGMLIPVPLTVGTPEETPGFIATTRLVGRFGMNGYKTDGAPMESRSILSRYPAIKGTNASCPCLLALIISPSFERGRHRRIMLARISMPVVSGPLCFSNCSDELYTACLFPAPLPSAVYAGTADELAPVCFPVRRSQVRRLPTI